MSADTPPSIDGLAPPASESPVPESSPATPPPPLQKRMKFALLVLFGVPYICFVLWCFVLLSVLPSASGTYDYLITIGSLSCFLVAAILLGCAALAFSRILKPKNIAPITRIIGAARIIVIVVPGLILALITPFVIRGEPRLGVAIVEPTVPHHSLR